jgi:hypothetical protein
MKKLILLFYFLFIVPVYALNLDQNFINQFDSIALKTIRNSETVFSNSNKTKNEFNGIKDFKNILGDQRKQFDTKAIYPRE